MSVNSGASGWFFRIPSTGEGQAQSDVMISDRLVLVVNDSPFIRRSCSSHLRKRGYGIIEAKDGQEAVTSYQDHRPDAVLLDLRMPDMDALATLKGITGLDPAARVVLITNGSKQEIDEALRAGARGFVLKPFSGEHIVSSVQALLSSADPKVFAVHGWSRPSHDYGRPSEV